MTTDRRKAVLFLSLTLFIGIVIGAMIPAVYGRFTHRYGHERGEYYGKDGKERKGGRPNADGVTKVVLRVVQPDSQQVKLIRPITQETTEQIRSLEQRSKTQMDSIFGSMRLKLKPILTEEQNKKLEEFSVKARQRWRERR